MDVEKLIDIAAKLDLPALVTEGVAIAKSTAAFAAEVKANAARAEQVLSDGDRAELDAIHAEALATADALDAKLAAASDK